MPIANSNKGIQESLQQKKQTNNASMACIHDIHIHTHVPKYPKPSHKHAWKIFDVAFCAIAAWLAESKVLHPRAFLPCTCLSANWEGKKPHSQKATFHEMEMNNTKTFTPMVM
jgi:hypothetical protein